jgi:hypothetical protein
MSADTAKTPTTKGSFTVEAKGNYIHLTTIGKLDAKHVSDPADAALELAQKENIHKLLDDIRQVDSTNVTIQIQSKGFGVLWKLRAFDRVAVVFGEGELSKLFFSTLQAMGLGSKFRGFDNESDAIAWLQDEVETP